jgi:purine-nucleoside phosphorylase
VPARLRPSAPIAADAILVGDPGRALLLAQALLVQPKMSNHARGLWGYTGETAEGRRLSVQATGMGGPSAAVVLADLVELGVRRAIRVGTCVALKPELAPGQLLSVVEAHAWSGPARRGAAGGGEAVRPDRELADGLRRELGPGAGAGTVASLDTLHSGGAPAPVEAGDVADMQTAAVLWRGAELGTAVAAVLVVTETAAGARLADEPLEAAAKLAGTAALRVLSS